MENARETGKKVKESGLRLLKKGRRGLLRVLFSRTGIVVLMLLFNLVLLIAGVRWLRGLLAPYLAAFAMLFGLVTVVYLLNTRMDASAKLTWLMLIMLVPTVCAPLFFYIRSDLGHRALKERIRKLNFKTKSMLPQREEVRQALAAQDPGEIALLNYLQRVGNFPVYDQCRVQYFPCGEAKFEELKNQLRGAKRFIFMEYFIVDEGRMWGEVLEILAEKAAQGVTVRFLYDGSCEFTTLTRDYPERLKKLGIECRVFSPATPFVSTYYNYRDHRKIAVIDGHTAFTGGVNLADEYINECAKYGHWKDAALMVQGEAARSFTLLFLQMWNLPERGPEFTRYLMAQCPRYSEEKGYVIPYGDCPLDEYRVGEMVYMDILNRATRYVHIMSPYLILDGELETALCFAAQRGVQVSLILPGIPDKKWPYALAKTHYKSLMEAGVEIYEYEPGFVHSKVFVSDDIRGVVGTINLDYRSLYHHFECAAYLYRCDCLADMEKDFQQTKKRCRRVTEEQLKARPLGMKLRGWLMKVMAPLF